MHSLIQVSHISSLYSWQVDHGRTQIILIGRYGRKGPSDFCIYMPSGLPKAEIDIEVK